MNWSAQVVFFLLPMSLGMPNPAFPDEPRQDGVIEAAAPNRSTPKHDGYALTIAGGAVQDDRERQNQGVDPDEPGPEARRPPRG